ncbi:MAG: FG-GAP-like repeat-containing protein [Pyrinomonadaceae bacterium]|nr:FG-GAP-like repeat-containing protein [Pyrinomonadaceae bacterium]
MRTLIFNCKILRTFFALFVFSVNVTAQTLDAGDIIYSRLPVAPSPSGTIWAVRQDGTNDRQIAAGSQPRLSPDNRYLILRRNQFPTLPYQAGQLFVRDLTTNTETLVFTYNNATVGYFFTPDSAQIVYDDGDFSGIVKINRDGTNRTFVGGSSVFDDFPVVRAGDGLIAHHRFDSSPTAGIYTLTANGSSQQFVQNTLNGVFPSWSADGQFIGYGSASPVGYPYSLDNLFKIKPDGSGKVQLTNLTTSNNFGAGFAWTTNGASLITAANINGTAGLYSVNADGSDSPVLIPTSSGAAPDFVGAIVPGQAGGGGNYSLLQLVVASGGETSASGNYSMTTTIGEAVAGGSLVGGTYNLGSGFWGGGQSASPTAGRTRFDFDGDGKADVSVYRPSNGTWYLQQSTAGFTGVQFGVAADKIVPADYDGDGKTDFAVYRGGTWYLLRSQAGFTGASFGGGSDIPHPADFDGDGKAELAVFRPSNGTWYFLNLVNNQFNAVQFGQNGDRPVVGDYDGDGKADVAVFRSSNGAWYLQRSALGFTGFLFGFSTDVPVPADFDGDGKTDIAVFRPSSGTWYLQQSTTGFTGVAFGISTDLPTPADYDGDGKTDVAVYRPSSGIWYSLNSTAGFSATQFGISTDVPIPNAYVP